MYFQMVCGNIHSRRIEYGALAQWIESQTSNLSVGGSSPSCLTKKNTLLLGCIFLSVKSRGSNPKGHQASRKPSWMVFSEMVQACLTGAGRRTHQRAQSPSCLTTKKPAEPHMVQRVFLLFRYNISLLECNETSKNHSGILGSHALNIDFP